MNWSGIKKLFLSFIIIAAGITQIRNAKTDIPEIATKISGYFSGSFSEAAKRTAVYFSQSYFEVLEGTSNHFSESPLEREIEKKWKKGIIGTCNQLELGILNRQLEEVKKNWDNFDKQMPYVKSIDLTPSYNPQGYLGCARAIIRNISLWDISDWVIVHEMNHIYHLNHPKIKELDKEWQIATGYSDKERRSLYEIDQKMAEKLGEGKGGVHKWKEGAGYSNGPRYGFVCTYGAKNPREDISTYCTKIYGIVSFLKKWPRNSQLSCNIPKEDPRYLKKLKLLEKYGFISPREYEMALPHFAK
jgi:hypothetical protein